MDNEREKKLSELMNGMRGNVMFDFGNANENQRKAIETTEGPVLITAGPGTGKTFTLVKRAVYLIEECGVKPEEIMIATFAEKAAKEIITRLTNELDKTEASDDFDGKAVPLNLQEMYVDTFHSICLKILEEHLEYTKLKKNYKAIDQFDQQYIVYQHYDDFAGIDNSEAVLTASNNDGRKDTKWENINYKHVKLFQFRNNGGNLKRRVFIWNSIFSKPMRGNTYAECLSGQLCQGGF